MTVTDQPVHHPVDLDGMLSEAGSIYACLYPNRVVTLILHDVVKNYWGQSFELDSAAPELGRMTLQPTIGPVAGEIITVRLAPPAPAETGIRADPPWAPPRMLASVFVRSPLAYEGIRHKVEVWRKWHARKRRLAHDDLPDAASVSKFPAGRDLPPAVLIGMHWLEVGGAEKMGFMAIDWALAAGLRVFVVSGTASAQRLASRLPDHPDVIFLRPDLYLQPADWPRYLANLISTQNIRLTHNHHCTPLYNALPYLKLATPWVNHIDSTHIVETINGGYPQMSALYAPYIDVHHVISKALVTYLRDDCDIIGQIRLGRMLHDDEETSKILPNMTMVAGQAELHVVFVGRLSYQKRPVVVVEMLRRVARWASCNGVILRATMVGEGPFADTVTALLERYGLTNLVTRAQANSDVPAVLRSADILLVPSSNEGLALVCYEAIEQGCIPLSTAVGAHGEIIPPDLLVPVAPGSAVRRTVQILDRLWRDPSFMAAQQTALHALYASIRDDPTAYDVLMPIYKAVADGRDIT